ncbi:dienelactone hydrolase family protein [soil metagenome]
MCHAEQSFPVSGDDSVIEERIEIEGEGAILPSYFVRPEGQSAPAVLVIHDVNGANDFYEDLARRLAHEGFAALLPNYFVRQGPLPEPTLEASRARAAQLDEPTTMLDIAHTLRWLEQQDGTNGSVGAVGFCMGGTLALLSAGRDPLPAAVVSYYGFLAGRQGWPDRPLDEVEALQAPALAFWGDQDHGVGMDNVAAYEKAVVNAGKNVETVIYAGRSHGFLTFDPDSPSFASAQDSWQQTLGFFRRFLTS